MALVKLDFKGLWQAFVATDPIDSRGEDIISNSDKITEQERKELLATLKRNEKLEERSTGIPAYKATRLEVNSRRSIQKALEENPVKLKSESSKEIKQKDNSEELEQE